MTFSIDTPDNECSPLTGMGWQHWAHLGEWLLGGVFQHITDLHQPPLLPRHETKVSYPQPVDPPWRNKSEIFEGVARTLLIASPLLKHRPNTNLNDIRIADYYRGAISALADPASESYVGMPDDIAAISGKKPFQMICECASLVIALNTASEVLWDPLPEISKERLLNLLSAWGHYQTHPHNWRLFNILTLRFVEQNGRPIDQRLYRNHLRCIDSFYAGDGWYRDGTLFDYYSVWAFQFYLSIWISWLDDPSSEPLAKVFSERIRELLRTYDRCFSRTGEQLMWGRSNIYRFAASAPFGSAFLLEDPGIEPGIARAILSSNVLQFVQHDKFLINGVPALGFYGPFAPMVQPYSCAASPFWFGNAYHAVALGPDHPFWTASEKPGSWEKVLPGTVQDTELKGPGLVVSQFGNSGATEMRTGKVMTAVNGGLLDLYSRHSFNAAFPWQATTADGIASNRYNLKTDTDWASPNLICFGGLHDGVLYRRIVFDFKGALGRQESIDLIDWSLPDGFARIDKLRFPSAHEELLLTHHALPLQDGELTIEKRFPAPSVMAITAMSGKRRLALVVSTGWDSVHFRRDTGLHPTAKESVLLYARSRGTQQYHEDVIRVSVLLHRVDGPDWTDEELWPFSEDTFPAAGDLEKPKQTLSTRDGKIWKVDFSLIEANLVV
jgi:hypothetical protein